MPELPEVEVVCQGLIKHLPDRQILSFRQSGKSLRKPIPTALIRRWVVEETILSVRRRAKFILLDMANASTMILHLGMTGRLGLFPWDSRLLVHDHACWRLDNGLELRLNDTRRFGLIHCLPPGLTPDHFFAELGPDPFWEDFSPDYLIKKGSRRNGPVKNFLMDNRIVTGIGNIYASETLFASAIHPAKPTGEITRQQWRCIIQESRRILSDAIACGGTTISDYVNSSGEKGYFQVRLKVYAREGLPCLKCGAVITKMVLAGRATFLCPKCQKEEG
ncbi:MAG: bifunctional DNA-formamidopyrimidine glycosylase/DNA-(apurinic or apyrimidinic site) lyase [Proteobacteria bacterium]|nr:bifunctional DNA-formamidopyrimidine glycosylase/DNA-(apurinic or apyrimidinic site) lyase [Pseudomonadota bacterium]MBU1687029.1 bifunctional DNA-formamidopyrimidine glycosylase/DNA-(apurinic or apyrimidinic site) lyase [Pseudomonadota bacterium]